MKLALLFSIISSLPLHSTQQNDKNMGKTYPSCGDLPTGSLDSCQTIVQNVSACMELCKTYETYCHPEIAEDDGILCIRDNYLPLHADTLGSHYQKLSAHIKARVDPTIAPVIIHPNASVESRLTVIVNPYKGRIIEVNEKQQTIGVIMALWYSWYDHRLSWNASEFGNITELGVRRDSVWTPQLFPAGTVSFFTDDMSRPLVQVTSSGEVVDYEFWNFRTVVSMQFDKFPFDRQTFNIGLTSFQYCRLVGPHYIEAHTQSESEWRLVEDFEKTAGSGDNLLQYSVTMKRYPFFWIYLIIVPCFVLGFLVIAALTLGADSNSIEALVNIGLAASVASAMVVSTMVDHFPKTEGIPSLGYFVFNQFVIIISILITLAIRTACMPKIDEALEKWTYSAHSRRKYLLVKTVLFLKHRLFLFGVFGLIYSLCFGAMMLEADLNFDLKPRRWELIET